MLQNSKTYRRLLKRNIVKQPESAVITLKAQGKIGEGISCKVRNGQSHGRSRSSSCDRWNRYAGLFRRYVARSIGGLRRCYSTSSSTAIGVEIKGGTIKAEGDLDFKGTLGVSKEAPVDLKIFAYNLTLILMPVMSKWQALKNLLKDIA